MSFGILKFQEVYMERIWGGNKLQQVLGRNIPTGAPVGEAWLIADHPACESVVAEGPLLGKSLRNLMQTDAAAILGDQAKPTDSGRFPLLLKLIDAGDVLSVQVHPDDKQAKALNEFDGGKTEMWYVLDAESGSTLLSGLSEGITPETLEASLRAGTADRLMQVFPVSGGDAVFVAAGEVHAIGAGILLAEIQQNSDVTYRLFDWNRVDKNGNARELHIDKALQVIKFGSTTPGLAKPVTIQEEGYTRERLAVCPYFVAEKIVPEKELTLNTKGKSFHIVQATEDGVILSADNTCVLKKGEAALVPADVGAWSIASQNPVLHYYVPDGAAGSTGVSSSR